jgi:choline monooxygenase
MALRIRREAKRRHGFRDGKGFQPARLRSRPNSGGNLAALRVRQHGYDRAAARRPLAATVRDRHPVACNWKVYVENYLDGFHLEENDQLSASHDSTHLHSVRIVGELALCDNPHHSSSESLWAWIWPNLGITVYRGVLLIEQMRPDGPDRMQVDHIFLHTPEDPGIDAAIHASEGVSEDHAWLCGRVQQNLDAGIFREGILLSSQESAVAWFQSRVAQSLALK